MYTLFLALHSLTRWAVVLCGVIAVYRALRGWTASRAWTPADDRAGFLYTVLLDVQFLIGLVLYLFLSPVTGQALRDMGRAMSEPVWRFWAVEHVTMMVLALVIAHVGRVRLRKAADPRVRHRRALVFFAISLVLVLAGIPWPGTANGRPLLRLG